MFSTFAQLDSFWSEMFNVGLLSKIEEGRLRSESAFFPKDV